MKLLSRALIAITVLVGLGVPASAMASTSTATGDGLTATLSWTGQLPQQTNLHLEIQQAGQVVYNLPIVSKQCGKSCSVADFGTQAPVRIKRLGAKGTSPSVIVNLYSGGASCCSVAQIYSPNAAGQWRPVGHNFGESGYRIEKPSASENALPVFLTADDAFACRFTDCADSGMPLQLLSLQGSTFVNVTLQYRQAIKANAAQFLKAFRAMAPRYAYSTGVMAAWAADEAELGNASQAFVYLRQQASLKRLNSGLTGTSLASNAPFVTQLHAFLLKRGYLK